MTSDKGFASDGKHKVFADHLIQKRLPKNEDTFTTVKNQEPIKLSDPPSNKGNEPSTGNFEEALECMQSKEGQEMPENLHGGILLDQIYIIAPKDLNSILFAPQSQFRQDLAELQGTMDYQEGPWMQKRLELSCLIRIVTYIKAATKLVKAVKATEEQTYLKADGKEFAVLTSVSTPDVPYGNCFKVELLFKITPGPNLSTEELSSHLVISWAVNFHQSTVMKGMIEGGVRQGLKESYNQFADFLAQKVKPVNSTEVELHKDQVLASLYQEHHSDWDLAVEYFCNFTVVVTIFMGLYILVHILLSRSSVKQGLEFYGLDLPDSFGELITSGIFVLQAARVYNMILHFIQARFRKGSDHGVKAQGDGWLLSVALIEGNNLLPADSNGFSDPYVVFTCNGKSRTSSVQLQTFDPQWNDILEFDAMQEPPSVLDVEVFDFDGPFDQAFSLGHAEINFLKYTSAELADLWIPLEGKLAQASQARLHLRVFLDNSKGAEAIREYLKKMEKEVGKKLNPQPPHRNSQFQKLFGLPPEEFLIKDYSCYLRKRIPLQGRLFLSARIVGFYSNIFGHKTKFFFLWDDIDDIQVMSPSLASVGTPSLMMILRPSRGFAARHGAKSQDEEGRFKFFFQSFVSFNAASRTIMALWRTRTGNLEQSAKLAEDLVEQSGKSVQIEDTSSFLTVDDANLSKIYSGGFPFSMDFLTRIFDGGNLEQKIMAKAGCLNYTTSPWELVKSDVYERHVRYKFSRHVSIFGGGVTSTQQKTSRPDGDGWVIDEVMTLHEVPFSDHFRVKFRYQIACSITNGCRCDVYIAIVWLKNIKFQRRITRNIREKFTHRVKEIFELAKKDFLGMDGG
ncbi:C2 and GRAM domain-containing protein [Acorus calamus]|uniref:C2 and GRAM domain-containing protein n=1 Tax=Acorus calamus TaxID=4465 RepID=A0AAV9CZN5_ACOCL|nr:C2 and GRAM domain-containing protein [Acorus calamus]